MTQSGADRKASRGDKPHWQKNALFWASLVGTATAAVVAATGVFSLFKTSPTAPAPTTGAITVTSNNQTGGITAGVVNMGPPQRKVTPDVEALLKSHAPVGAKVWVCAVSDPEAQTFASAIAEFLKSAGYMLTDPGVCTTVPSKGEAPTGIDYLWVEDPRGPVSDKEMRDTLNVRIMSNPNKGASG